MNDNPPSNEFVVSINVSQTIRHAHTVSKSTYPYLGRQLSSSFPLFFFAECGNQGNEDNPHSYIFHHEDIGSIVHVIEVQWVLQLPFFHFAFHVQAQEPGYYRSEARIKSGAR